MEGEATESPIKIVKKGRYSYFCGSIPPDTLNVTITRAVSSLISVNNDVLGAPFGESFDPTMTVGNVMFICDVCKDAFEPEPKVSPANLTQILKQMFLNKFDREIDMIVHSTRCTYKNYKHKVEEKIKAAREGRYTCEEVKFFYVEDLVPLSQNNAPGVDIAIQESDNAPWHTNPNIDVAILDGSSIDPASRDASKARFRFPPPGIEVTKTKDYLDSIGHVAIEEMKYVFMSGPEDAATSPLIAKVASAGVTMLEDGDCITSITFVDEAIPFVKCKTLILVRKTTAPGAKGRASFAHKATIIVDRVGNISSGDDKCVGNPVKNSSLELILFFCKYFGDEEQCVGHQIFQTVMKILNSNKMLCIFTVDGTVSARSEAMLNAYFVHNHGKKFKDESGYEIKKTEFLVKNKSTFGVKPPEVSTVNSILCIPEKVTPAVIHKRLIDRIKREYLDQANSVFNSLTKAQRDNIIYLGMRGNEHIAVRPQTKAYEFITGIKIIIETLIDLITSQRMIWPPEGADYQEMKSYMSAIEIKRIVSPRHSQGLPGIAASNSEKKLFTVNILGITTNQVAATEFPNLAALETALLAIFGGPNYNTYVDYAGGFSIALQKNSRQ